VVGRPDLPPREPSMQAVRNTQSPGPDSVLSSSQHLGAYEALIAAVRDELEHFVASHVRLHLAIADHDRFLLTAIGVSCSDDAESRRLLLQFMREFKPEQVKRYLAREVIGALPNAAAIDLTQFAGLLDADARADAESDNEYADLLAALRSDEAPEGPSFKVNIVGRWTEFDAVPGAVAAASAYAQPGATPSTPLAGQRCEFDVEDGDGKRRVVLQSVIPGRRYMIGKGEGCDIRINGSYTSRRHAELWLENGTWRIADAGSTNGIRVEPPSGPVARCSAGQGGELFIELVDGARIVLSAHAEGSAAEYPWLALRTPFGNGPRVTPIASAGNASPKTPVTPIHPAGAKPVGLTMTAHGAGGEHTLDLLPGTLPISVGRSRNQALVVGRVHELVSGHHLDIIDIDETGAQVLVHGDNGVVVDGIAHSAGTHFVWKIGQTMLLGAAQQPGPQCSLALSRRGSVE
jgi:hypothetical protein